MYLLHIPSSLFYFQATSPQTGGPESGGSLKSMKDKSSPQDKDVQEGSTLKTAGPGGEITAGLCLKCQINFLVMLFLFLA